MASTNPWVQDGTDAGADEFATPLEPAAPALAAAADLAPQRDSVARPGGGLPRRGLDVPRGTVGVCLVGTHGGAGESTLEQLLEGSRAMAHAWPCFEEPSTDGPPVILVARTSARGLCSAQLAATEWASGTVPVRLLGLVLIADAAGRLPRPLRDFAQVVAGGVPRVWRIPWVEKWRLGDPVSAQTAPAVVTKVLGELRAAVVSIPIP